MRAIWGSDYNDIYVAANDGHALLHFDGAAWRTVVTFSPGTSPITALWGTGPKNVYAGGAYGIILHGQR